MNSSKKIKIVAEIGCNHNGNINLAKKMILKAKECGVDAVKFQTFNANKLISRYAPKADYQKKTTVDQDSQLEMTKKLELSKDEIVQAREYAHKLNIEFFSTPFDIDSVDFLHSLGQKTWKIPSGEITNLPYLEAIGNIITPDMKIILSTGMSTIDEIKDCVSILNRCGVRNSQLTIMHCNTEYPTQDVDVNLMAINDIKNNFPDSDIGFSDHSLGYVAAVGSVMLGVQLIEKHFTLDKNMYGPDHKASVNPEELKALVENVRRAEIMRGKEKKIVTSSERKNMVVARKSIVAAKPIKKGETFTSKNITCKRPGNGISPMFWYDIIGLQCEKDTDEDQLVVVSGYEFQL